jgi:NAD(P)H-hydrate epimerase
LQGLYSLVVSAINASDAFVLAVDIPSGMFADSVQRAPLSVKADVTVTFTAPKITHVLSPDQESIGELRVVPIGSPVQLMDRPDYYLNLLDLESVASGFPVRRIASHKGDYGHVAVVAGSRGKSGAATLSGLAALKSGSGLVTVCSPDVVQDGISSYRPELMTEGLSSSPPGTLANDCMSQLERILKDKHAVGLGPGLGTQKETVEVIHRLVKSAKLPLVIDADGINAFAGCPEKIINRHGSPLVLTPHPGEFSRLTGDSAAEISSKKIALARKFAVRQKVWLVLKDFRTLIAEPSGQVYVCPNGNPGMATAGMGDVLTGVLTSVIGLFFCRGMTSTEQITKAVVSAVFLHSLAGDLAALNTGFEALTSGSVIDHLDQAFAALRELDG